jgi:heme exporter protein C
MKRLSESVHAALTLAWLFVALYMIFLYAPREETMGEVQRIFYFHAPSGITAFVAYFVVALGSVMYLAKRKAVWDELANSAAEIGFIFCSCNLVTGPLWAKPVWGIWWTWDWRLTSTFILWVLFIAYLILRSYLVNPERAAPLCAVLGVIGFVGSIFDYMAIRWFRTQHPQPVILGGPGSGMDPRMLATFLVSWGALTCLFTYLLRQRMALAGMRCELDGLRRELISQNGEA